VWRVIEHILNAQEQPILFGHRMRDGYMLRDTDLKGTQIFELGGVFTGESWSPSCTVGDTIQGDAYK
jgi:hypothetical protein